MKTSASIALLSKSFVTAQAELKNAHFDSVNPHFKNKYASLPGMRDGLVPVLTKHGLAIIQGSTWDGHAAAVVTRMVHESGEWIEASYPLAIDKPQQMGSAVTYARRYSLAAICGIASDDDDDGNEGQKGDGKPNVPTGANGAPAMLLTRDEARKLYKDLETELHTLASDSQIDRWKLARKSDIEKLGDWKGHIDNAIADHISFLLNGKGKAA